MAAVANDRIKVKKDKLTVSLCPFRYIKGASLLVMMEKSKSEQKKKAFLLDKFDSMSLPIVVYFSKAGMALYKIFYIFSSISDIHL